MKHSVLIVCAIVLMAAASVDAGSHRTTGTPADAGSKASTSPKKISPQFGSLEGIVASVEGPALWAPGNTGGIHVTGVSEDGRAKFDVATDPTMGGFYHVDKLRAGYYDLKIQTAYINGIAYRPQVIYAVEIKPDGKTSLNLTIDRGETLNVVGTPVYPTREAARAAEEAQEKTLPAAAAGPPSQPSIPTTNTTASTK